MSTTEAERWLALEFITVAVIRTIYGMRESRGLLGPQQFGAMLVAYALLSVLVMYQPTAALAAMLGALVLLAVLLRPTVRPDGTLGNLGADTAKSVAAFARNVGTSSPSLAKGATVGQ